MVFSSPIFIFLFLPIVLAVYFILDNRYRNTFLLAASLIFYAWGEPRFVLVMISSIMLNYVFGIWVASTTRFKKFIVVLAVVTNLGLLVFFKYTNFIFANLNPIFHNNLTMLNIALPLGISFYTFHSLSYVIDVYRQKCNPQRKFTDLALYITFFPQLVAGPIIRYHDIKAQLRTRTVDEATFAYGVNRFIIGLGKKMLLANPTGLIADQIFSIPFNQLSPSVAWLGIICYTLQIYFDFSGYSDMAIGLAKMFGFTFLENFNYPYISKSIREFWQRWHISLSNWFRDYLYIPLGGNRKTKTRTYINLGIVFLVTGVWHGASWNFVVWGLYHGSFMIIERVGWGKILERLSSPIQHLYAIVIVMIGWVFFRSDSLTAAITYLNTMFGLNQIIVQVYDLSSFLNPLNSTILIFAILSSFGFFKYLTIKIRNIAESKPLFFTCLIDLAYLFLLGIIILKSVMELASNTYNPFIYFRF
ncbi:MAG: MBOAT family O-acyltransferase [Desulfitobacterium sp.]